MGRMKMGLVDERVVFRLNIDQGLDSMVDFVREIEDGQEIEEFCPLFAGRDE